MSPLCRSALLSKDTASRETIASASEADVPELRLGQPVHRKELARVERRLNLELNKWDTQVGDTEVLSSQPIILTSAEWARLSRVAEELAAKLDAREGEVLADRTLQEYVGVPRSLQPIVSRTRLPPRTAMRTMRFDFHPTPQGWRVSEVNSDVPGGWREATSLPQLFHEFFPELIEPPSPLPFWCEALQAIADGGPVALLSAPGFLEDQQVVLTFERELRRRGVSCFLIQTPGALEWTSGKCRLPSEKHMSVSAIVRFYQIEWLCRLPRRTGWEDILRARHVPVVNPTISALSESKRFALNLPGTKEYFTWGACVPESRDPRTVDADDWEGWALKRAYSNTGDGVYLCADLPKHARTRLVARAQKHPLEWVAQRRFETAPLDSVRGPLFPCIGVFVVNGRAVGAYGRLSTVPIIGSTAIEAPVMIDPTLDSR